MESTLLEIVELDDGDIVLQRADGEGSPLINIKFSAKTKAYIPNIRLEVAKAMIQAGIQAFSEIAAEHNEEENRHVNELSEVSEVEEELDHVLH